MVDYFDWGRVVSAAVQILPCLWVTAKVVLISDLAGIILGLLVSQVRINRTPVLYQLVTVFISFMRGTPLIVQLILSYYFVPRLFEVFGINAVRWPKLVFAYIAYGLNQAAFVGEMFRSSIEAIPVGQIEAAKSLGFKNFQTYRHVIIPQMTRIVLPAFGNDFVGLFQGTSLVYLLGIMDVMGRAKAVGTYSGHYLEPYLVALTIYVIISLVLNLGFSRIEKNLEKWR
ncbi:MAG: amino acid ABC transporter permease [Spirochaetaceae bacterium]|nr:amino acid ABC transporter permease [Spirochaetaceae bacterium]